MFTSPLAAAALDRAQQLREEARRDAEARRARDARRHPGRSQG